MDKFATRYEILRGVSSTGRAPCVQQPSAKPLIVAFLLNEKKFTETGGLIKHHDTVFLDDPGHDWDWRNGKFYYYGHAMGAEDTGDIVAIMAQGDQPVCSDCGASHQSGQNTLCAK
jgi:hypothetical protein